MTSTTPPGWYPDNADPGLVRWWDGAAWTSHTDVRQRPAAPAQTAPPARPAEPSQPEVSTSAQAGEQVAQLPGQARPSRSAGSPDPYAAQASSAYDPYARQAQQQRQPAVQQQATDPYAQQVKQQPSYPAQGRLEQFNESIAQGYGDQSFGGHVSGPVDGRQAAPGRTVFTEPVLVVSQKRKIIEVTNEYAVYAQDGSQLGAVVEVGQSGMKKAIRLLSNYDQFLTHRLEVRDNNGQVLLQLTRPAKVFKSTIVVQASDGREIGRLVQQNVFGKIRFGLLADGQEVGSLNAENWRAWNFALADAQGVEIARVTKTWEGLLTTMFTTADNYVVHIHHELPDPLRSLCVAAALTIDTALKQDDR